MTRLTYLSIATVATSLVLASPTLAKEGDVEACIDKVEGDDCTRADGDGGVCQPDDSDPNVLKCDDDALDDSSEGCSTTGRGGDGSGLLLAAAALFVGRFRRRD